MVSLRWLAAFAGLPFVSCMGLLAEKHTYGGMQGAELNGARVGLQVKPEGTDGGNYVVSALVIGGGVATLDGPFRWRIEAVGEPGVHQWLALHRIRTRTEVTGRDEWYPAGHLRGRVEFRAIRGQPERVRARYEIPGQLRVKPREDGALDVWVDLSIATDRRTERALVRFHLDPLEKRQDEFIFLPAEIVEGIGTSPEDWDDPGWD